jgi:glutathione S-transferase
MALTLYGRLTSGNVHKVAWLLKELDIPHTRIDTGMAYGFPPGYELHNPMKKVPTIDDGGFWLWESNTILRYLANTRAPDGTIYPKEAKARAEVDKWMDWLLSALGAPIAVLFWTFVRTEPEKRDLAAADKARVEAEGLAKMLDGQLAHGKGYITGEHLTIADIAIAPFIHRWFNMPVERPKLENLEKWYKKIGEHEGCKEFVLVPMV